MHFADLKRPRLPAGQAGLLLLSGSRGWRERPARAPS